MDEKCTIQKTLFGDEIVKEYTGVDAWGETIVIPNFQPLDVDDNPRLDTKKQYSILVHLETEEQQEVLYNILKDKGLRCKKN